MTKLEALKKQYSSIIERFKEVLQEKKNDIVRDSSIKRFELCFDLSWKILKAFLEEEKNVKCFSPKECFKEAYHQGIITYSELWIKMADDRNFMVHTYKEDEADKLYSRLPGYLKMFEELFLNLEK